MSITKQIVIVIWTICLISNTECIQVTESFKEGSLTNENVNTTTLYPVDNSPLIKTNTERNEEITTFAKKSSSETANWNINTTFAFPKELDEAEEYYNEQVNVKEINEDVRDYKEAEKEINSNKELTPKYLAFPKEDESEADLSKVKAVLNQAREIENSKQQEKEKISYKDFKPSPYLNSYYDTLEDTPHRAFTSFAPMQKPTSSFIGSPMDQYKPTHNKRPEEFIAFPYKYENSARSHYEWSAHGLQSMPTVEAPARTPAGGLYKLPSISKERPSSYGDDDDLSLESNDNVKEISEKKRSNPWKSLLNLVTALLPVGLIASALTPSIITVQSTGLESQPFKRSSRGLADSRTIPAVSEQCKRRLLCEIHSEGNYNKKSPYHRPKQCYKISCEDPHAVSRVLHWLLAYYRTGNNRGRDNKQYKDINKY